MKIRWILLALLMSIRLAAAAPPPAAGEGGTAAPEATATEGHEGHPGHPGHHDHGAMANARMLDRMISPDGCAPGEYYLLAMSMCLPRPRAPGAARSMPMLNAFFVDAGALGPRGYHGLSGPNWLMTNAGVDLTRWLRLELDLMLTLERWTFPERGYPTLLQIGEADAAGRPYIDAQHPHSSPIMGLALTGVLSLSATRTRLLRLSFAPRGASSDGPIPFMHRPTGMVMPDPPLGHHVGQDAGHISSTVIGLSAYLGGTIIEATAFHGQEPSPSQVDLPLGAPDSFALRLSQHIGRPLLVSASAAYVRDPEGGHGGGHGGGAAHEEVPYVVRVSASAYAHQDLPRGWRSHAALIFGGIAGYDGVPFLASLAGEALFAGADDQLFSRIEVLQRTAAQLAAPSPEPAAPRWVAALSVGYSRRVASLWAFDLRAGAAGTLSLLDEELAPAYGGRAVVSGRLFLQAVGMRMWDLGR